MTDLETILAMYSAGITFIAIAQHLKANTATRKGAALLAAIIGISEGAVKIERVNGGIKLTSIGEDHGNTSKQAGQSEGTDRS